MAAAHKSISSKNCTKGNSSLSPFSLSFLSRERDLFDRSLPEREDFEPVRRFSLLSPLVYREQSMSMNYFIVTTITENIYKNMKWSERKVNTINNCFRLKLFSWIYRFLSRSLSLSERSLLSLLSLSLSRERLLRSRCRPLSLSLSRSLLLDRRRFFSGSADLDRDLDLDLRRWCLSLCNRLFNN